MIKMFFRKSYVVIYLISICAFGCEERMDSVAKLQTIKESELNTGVRNDTIFLGFTFGMTEKEFYAKTIELIADDEIKLGDKDVLKAEIYLEHYTSAGAPYATFSPEFYKGKLYELSVSVKSDTHNQPKLIYANLLNLLIGKYGIYDHRQETPQDNVSDYYWIDGSRMIKLICGYSDVKMVYLDIAVEAKILEEEKRRNEQLNDSIRKDEEAINKTKSKI